MRLPTRFAGLVAWVLGQSAVVALAGGPSLATPPPSPGGWHTVTLPVAASELCQAAGLPPASTPESLLFNVIRVLHERPPGSDDLEHGPTGAVLRLLRFQATVRQPRAPAPETLVPLPLAPETWSHAILHRRVEPPALVEAILSDRRASLLYVGLSRLHADSLGALERMPDLLAALDEGRAAVLAAFGDSLLIHDGVVRVPGSTGAQASWEALVGAPASDPARFLSAWLERDRGRLAYFFDSLMRLDAAHLRFVMGASADNARQIARLTSLYEIFRRVSPEWDAAQYPFYRPPVDPADVLSTLRVTADGRLAPAWPRRLWERALRGQGADAAGDHVSGEADADIDPAWLLGSLLAGGPKVAPARVAQVLFVQRVFARSGVSEEEPLAAAAADYTRFPTLMLALERLGVTRPTVYAQASGVARALARRDRAYLLPVFQGCLALVDRSAWARSIDPRTAERLTGSLLALDPERSDYDVRLADWLSTALLPAFADATGATVAQGAEALVLRSLAGVRAATAVDAPPSFEWSGRRYRVDIAAAALARFQPLRDSQGPPTLDQALGLYHAVGGLERDGARQSSVARLVRLLDDLGAGLPDSEETGELREAIGRARTRLVERAAGRPARLTASARRDLARARVAVLADVLVALAYLPHLGDPDGPVRLGGHVARRHAFAASGEAAADGAAPGWRTPRELVTPEGGWHVEGALLGLDEALGSLALRRLDIDVIPAGPRLDETARRRFVIDAARSRPLDLDDRDRDFVAEGLRAGRALVRRLIGQPEALGPLAASLSLDARRVQALGWAQAQGARDLTTRFSLGELLRLGARQPLALEVATIPTEACPKGAPACPRELSDLALRLVEGLADRHLPAALLPGLLGSATQDFIDEVQPFHADDLEALWTYAADVSRERLDDYIAALEGSGPLRLVTASSRAERRR